MTQKTYPIMNFIQVMCDKFYLIGIFYRLNIPLSYTVCQVINIELLTSVIKIVDGRLFFKSSYCSWKCIVPKKSYGTFEKGKLLQFLKSSIDQGGQIEKAFHLLLQFPSLRNIIKASKGSFSAFW